MKCVSIVIPTYNEEENIPLIYERITNLFKTSLQYYTYKILFIDNFSNDSSRDEILKLQKKDKDVQYIFNTKNFGFSKSTFYGLTQSGGDCTVLVFADMQDPPELICDFVAEWEKGYKVVIGIKSKSKENPIMYWIRGCYYKFVDRITDIEHIEHFTGFGLYDKSVIKIFRGIKDPMPYLRGIVAELAPKYKKVSYTQERRANGKSSFDFWKLWDLAMLGITSYSKVLMRLASLIGIVVTTISFAIAIGTFILKALHIMEYPLGNAAIIIGVFFLGGIQLLFLGVLGEYISNINIRTMNRPLVIEEERGGFEDNS